MQYQHQDWNTVILRNPKAQKAVQQKQQQRVKTVDNQSVDEKKLLSETESFHHKKVSVEDSKKIVQARVAAKLTQAQLAQRLNISSKDINDIERGVALYNGNLIAKIKKLLKIT